jgi:4-amino-4-deoxy-L-arabinose transferase-like glycosyltransferase
MIPDLGVRLGGGVFSRTRYIHGVRELLRQHLRFFLFAFLSALLLRLFFLVWFPRITDDTSTYVDIAKNWLLHGSYGLTELGKIVPTCIRLPGYPAFLAAVFAIFGVEEYRIVWVLQISFDLGTCFLIADMARRAVSPRAARAAFLLAALCPFLANYAAAALTETLEIFFTALALDCSLVGIESLPSGRIRPWLGCGLATGAAILLRPDGGLLLAAIGVYLAWLGLRAGHEKIAPGKISRSQVVRAGLVVGLAALAPLVPWTLRNLHTLHEFQPLAPRYSNDPDEFVPMGFNHWVKTWMADYVSVEEIYWEVPGEPIDAAKLPARAFDSIQERQQTAQLFGEYNQVLHMTPDLNARFAALAAERIRARLLLYYVGLPLVRMADMWLRPRTELLPCDTRWWEFNDDAKWSAVALALGLIGLLYPALALAGGIRGRFSIGVGLLVIFVILRTVFLGTLENPEARYTLECYPVVILLASAWLG